MSDDNPKPRERVRPEPGAARGADPLAHLDTVRRSIRAMAEPLQKLNTREFPPLTYVEDTGTASGSADAVPHEAAIPRRAPTPRAIASQLAATVPERASTFAALCARVRAFQERLGPQEGVGVMMPQLGSGQVLVLERVSYSDPDLVALGGVLQGPANEPAVARACEHVLSTNPLNLVFVAVPRADAGSVLFEGA